MSFFDDFLKAIVSNTKDEAGKAAASFLTDTTAEGSAFRADAERNLNEWEQQLVAGDIDAELMASLVRGQFDMTVLAALNRAGKSGQAARSLGSKLIGLALDTAMSMIPGGPLVKELAKIGVAVATAEVKGLAAGGKTIAAPIDNPTATGDAAPLRGLKPAGAPKSLASRLAEAKPPATKPSAPERAAAEPRATAPRAKKGAKKGTKTSARACKPR